MTSITKIFFKRKLIVSKTPLSLKENFAWVFIGNVIYALCQWIRLVIIVKFGTPELVGQFTLSLAITAPIIIFFNMGLRPIQATDTESNYSFSDYLALRIIMTIFALVAITSFSLISEYKQQIVLLINAIGVSKGIESLGEVFYAYLQKHERMDSISISMIIRSIINVFSTALFMVTIESVLLGVLVSSVISFILLFVFDLKNCVKLSKEKNKSFIPTWNVPKLRNLITLALPLGITAMMVSLNTNLPRYAIQNSLGEDELGFYGAMAYILVAGTTVVNALGQSSIPRLAKYFSNRNHKQYVKLLFGTSLICLSLGIIGIIIALVAGEEILTILYTPEYGARSEVFTSLMVSALALYLASFLNYALTACKVYKVQPYILLAVTISTFVCCRILIPNYGIIGAAWSSAISYFVQVVIQIVIIVLHLRKKAIQ